jgi:hypothetical protein
MLTKSLFTRLALCFLTASFFSLQAAETRGFDVGVLANGFNVIRGDATPLASGYGAGALVNWQWSADWRAGFQMGCAHVCAGNLEVGYRAHTFDYSRFRYPERAIYYIIGFGTKEVWLRFVTGINAVKDFSAQPGLGVGFSLHAFQVGNFHLAYGLNFYMVNQYMTFGLGQLFAALVFRL